MALTKTMMGTGLWRQMAKTFGINRKISFRIMNSDDDITCRYECFFNRDDIDGWDVRQGLNDLLGYEGVPEPVVITAALHACRRVNDYALTVRLLEAIKDRCGSHVKQIYPYVIQEISPTLCELGCDLPEALCYHKPELFLKSVYTM